MNLRQLSPCLPAGCIGVLLGAILCAGAAAQAPGGPSRRSDLDDVKSHLRDAEETRRALAAEIASLAGERAKLAQALIASASRARAAESRLREGEQRLADLSVAQTKLKASLNARRGVLAEVIASLQRIGREPPPALLVRPDAALESVRSAILLGAVLPELRVEAEALASDLRELVRLRADIAAEREQVTRDLADLAQEQVRLAGLAEERAKQQKARESDFAAQDKRVGDLAKQAETLESLITRMERDIEPSRRAAASAAAPGADRGGARDPGRLAPAIPFAQARGMLPLPASGTRLRAFGASDGFGGVERGLSLATRSGAQVTAPCDGWVVYAGPFRSYGQLLILNAGGGYHVLLAGMERISVGLGQFVLTGEPVAAMGGTASAAAVNIGSPQPVLYVEFRKDGVSIDPTPWWSDATSEKVGG